MFNKFTTRKSADALDVYTIKDVPPILLSVRPLEASRDDGFLIGQRELTGNVENRTNSYIRVTEVAPSNSAIVNGKLSIFMLGILLPAGYFKTNLKIFQEHYESVRF